MADDGRISARPISVYHAYGPSEIDALALYNAERARGLVHTAEWDARMAALRARFDAAQEAEMLRLGWVPTATGGWMFKAPNA